MALSYGDVNIIIWTVLRTTIATMNRFIGTEMAREYIVWWNALVILTGGPLAPSVQIAGSYGHNRQRADLTIRQKIENKIIK